mmetsp:Transcript_56314/g.121836  ORF Transcript_56314/g.121836 Transcript_56314/m.121836 type:complete len:231 (+) Transcript_56314:852-1544(+)
MSSGPDSRQAESLVTGFRRQPRKTVHATLGPSYIAQSSVVAQVDLTGSLRHELAAPHAQCHVVGRVDVVTGSFSPSPFGLNGALHLGLGSRNELQLGLRLWPLGFQLPTLALVPQSCRPRLPRRSVLLGAIVCCSQPRPTRRLLVLGCRLTRLVRKSSALPAEGLDAAIGCFHRTPEPKKRPGACIGHRWRRLAWRQLRRGLQQRRLLRSALRLPSSYRVASLWIRQRAW